MTQDILQSLCNEKFSLAQFSDFIHQSLQTEIYILSDSVNDPRREPLTKGFSKLKAYRKICDHIPLENDCKLGVFAFEVESLKAKVGLHTELKKFLDFNGGAIDSALACFYNPSDPSHFRLSLLSFQLDEQGALKTTSLKRQSFMLGEDGNKTAYHRLKNFKKEKLTSIQTINDIFSLEHVTAEFFNEISKNFDILSKNIVFPQALSLDERRQFTLRLIARILFCKFLEKKEVLPKEIFSSDKKSDDYYHEVLESLFFLTLNTPKESRDYGLLPDSVIALLSSIPYLNGGLFQPHPQDFFNPTKPTANYNDLKVPSEDLYNFLDTLGRFYFTIDESTPLDQEIGLDPEMLGMVFENLLASLGNETQNKTKNNQKSTGSYYTPREIVSYMARSSILKYLCDHTQIPESTLENLITNKSSVDLNNKSLLSDDQKLSILQALHRFKALDPACGSGAFPMGILQEICEILEMLDPDAKELFKLQDKQFQKDNKGKSPSYIRKLAILQNNIYGVDIQPIATEIARLRCFLSLICDEDKEHIAPLPNLEFKFITADTLMSIPPNVLEYDGFVQDLEKLEKIRQEFFQTTSSKDKDTLKESFQKLRADIARKMVLIGEENPLPLWDPFDHKQGAKFFDSKYMFGVESFDLIIGNPPYVQVPKGIYKKHFYPYSEGKDKGKQNLYKVFIELGFNLGHTNSVISFITQSSIMCDLSSQFTRELLLKETQMQYFVEFKKNQKLFTNVIQGVCILEFIKAKPKPNHNFKIAINNAESRMDQIDFEHITQGEILEFFPLYEIPLIKKGEMPIVAKVKRDRLLLKDMIEFSRQGNINTIHLKRIHSDSKTGLFLMKGENIHRYYLDNNFMHCVKSEETLKMIEENSKYHIIALQGITGTTDRNRIHCTLLESKNTNIFVFLDSTKMLFLSNAKEAKFLVGLLNSKLLDWLFRITSTNNNINLYELESLPIPKLDSQNKKLGDKIIALVEKILESKKQDLSYDTSVLESKIDSMVYELYGLEDSEIEIIETKN